MMQEILSAALNSGLWAALFCLLFFYQLKDSKEREKRYIKTVDSLIESLKLLDGVSKKCQEISQSCHSIKKDCTVIAGDCKTIKSGIKEIKGAKNEL